MGFKNARIPDVAHSQLKEIASVKGISMKDVHVMAINQLYQKTIYVDQRGVRVDLKREEPACYANGGEIIPAASESYIQYLDRVLMEEGVIRFYD